MNTLHRPYKPLKAITIALSVFYPPAGMFIGYCFGSGQYTLGTIALSLYSVLILADTWIGWRLLELLTKWDK